jgi:hypothetical protein
MAKPKLRAKVAGLMMKVGGVRLSIVIALGLAGAWLAFALAVSGVTRVDNPEIALSYAKNDSDALAGRADQIFNESPDLPKPVVQSLALASLKVQPINPAALRVLGYYTDAKGDASKAERLILASQNFSRREFGSQLWLIEASVRKNDVKQALVHYDLAMRLRPDAHALLFPTLLSALDDPTIREALRPYVHGSNEWASAFLGYANVNSKNLPALVDLVVRSGGLVDGLASQTQKVGLLSRLVAERYFADARRLYQTLPGASIKRLSTAMFDAADRDGRYGAIGWQLVDDPNAGGSFSGKASDEKTMLTIFANSATTSVVASKLLFLPPGPHRFAARLANLDRGDEGFLRWELHCQNTPNSPPMWKLDSISLLKQASFDLPSTCPVQMLYLIASGGKGQTGLEATITNIDIVKE